MFYHRSLIAAVSLGWELLPLLHMVVARVDTLSASQLISQVGYNTHMHKLIHVELHTYTCCRNNGLQFV